MKEIEFYVILPSNSSMSFYPENTTAHFTRKVLRDIQLEGDWQVGLSVQIPLTFAHLARRSGDQSVYLRLIRRQRSEDNKGRAPKDIDYEPKLLHDDVAVGLYDKIQDLIDNLNGTENLSEHLSFGLMAGNYVSIRRIGGNVFNCVQLTLTTSRRLSVMLGFSGIQDIEVNTEVYGDYPASLNNALPKTLMVYSDIIVPYVIGDVQARLLRAVPLNVERYRYGGLKVKNFGSCMYLPLLIKSFQTIEIDVRDEYGNYAAFEFGTSSMTLDFKKSA